MIATFQMKTTKENFNIRRDKGIFTGVILGFLIILLISTCSCSPSIKGSSSYSKRMTLPSQRVDNLVIQPDTVYYEFKEPKPDKAGKFITRATQIGIIVLSVLTVQGKI